MYYKHAQLITRLLGHYLMYHAPEFIHPSWHSDLMIPDSLYDMYKDHIISLGVTTPPELIEELTLKFAHSKDEWLGG